MQANTVPSGNIWGMVRYLIGLRVGQRNIQNIAFAVQSSVARDFRNKLRCRTHIVSRAGKFDGVISHCCISFAYRLTNRQSRKCYFIEKTQLPGWHRIIGNTYLKML